MDFFSFGNLFSVVIVLVVLIIYRQIDRNNRSLEKVKRFSDKMKDELAKSVEEKSAEMKNLAIELQVNMKAGKEVLKRIREVEDGLNERAQGIGEIRKRIDGYDHAMEELVGMTARVEENLKRIQAESVFVDKVGRRISGASESLKKVEQEIGHVSEKFRQENGKALQSLREEIAKGTEQRIREMAASVQASEKKVKDFGVYVTRLESRAEQMQSEVLEGLTNSFEQFELEAKAKRSGLLNQYVASLNKLLSEADAKGKVLKKNYVEALGSYEKKLSQTVKRGEALEGKVFENLKAMIARDSEAFGAQREGLRKKVEEIAAFRQQLGGQITTLLKDSDKLKEEGLQKISAAAEQMQISAVQSIEDRLEGFEKDIDYKFQRLEAANLDIEAMDKNLHAAIQKSSEKLRAEIYQFSEELALERDEERQKVEKEFSRLQEQLAELEEGVGELRAKAYENVSTQLQASEDEFFKDFRERSAAMEQRIELWQGEIDSRMKELAEAQVEERRKLGQRFSEEMKNGFEKTQTESFRDLKQLEARIVDFQASLAERLESGEQSVEGFRSSIDIQMEQARRQAETLLEEQIEELQNTTNQAVQKQGHEIEQRLRAMELSVQEGKKELEEIVDSTNGEIASWQARVARSLKEMELESNQKTAGLRQETESRVARAREDFAKQTEELVAAAKAEKLQLKEEFDRSGKELEEIVSSTSGKIADWQERIDKSLEQTDLEIAEKYADLREENEARVAEARDEFAKQAEQLIAATNEEKLQLKEELDRKRKELEEIVSATSRQIASWQEHINKSLEEAQNQVSDRHADLRKENEARAAAARKDFAKQTGELIAAAKAEKLQLKEEFDLKLKELEEIVGSTAGKISSWQGRIDSSLTELERDSADRYTKLREENEARFAAARDDFAKQTGELVGAANSDRLQLKAEFDSSGKELEEIMSSTTGEIASWQARITRSVKELEKDFTQKYASLRAAGDEQINRIREDFAGQSEELIASTNAERLQLQDELKGIREGVNELQSSLMQRSESALQAFKRQVEAFQAELNKRSKDMQAETDTRMRELKQRLTDMKEKGESQQASLFGKIEEGYQLLTINLHELDKRVKGFANQTKIFERADELKLQMEARIEEMKRDMEKLQLQRKEVEQLESLVVGAKKTVDEMSGKLTRLLAERGRVEDMDSDFKKLLNISKELDHRIGAVYANQDALQEIQAKIRELEKLEKITEGRFERLEKKSAIIEATTEGVDKNFQALDQLEKELKGAGKDLQAFSGQLEELKAQASELAGSREKSEYVIEKIKDLDSILSDLEERMGKLETAREWLAKTETRFETIGKQAQEQVRLMESILKADKKHSKLGEGAPPMDKRETVTKLAHLGWTPAEIARTTKLSRGEVELILELAPKA